MEKFVDLYNLILKQKVTKVPPLNEVLVFPKPIERQKKVNMLESIQWENYNCIKISFTRWTICSWRNCEINKFF